ncbi:MAG TPA: hypothetical protein DCG49_06545 [Ruminococcus sp.]|nr:hypothetical protein [Ruminococcus sp.]
MKGFLKAIAVFLGIIVGLLAAAVLIWAVIRFCYSRAPIGGISEEMYADINDTKQWISIYGKDKDAPVLLYLHDTPCSSNSNIDWLCLRRFSKDYIVVNWDQRGCGKNYPDYALQSPVTTEQIVSDAEAMTDFLCDHLGREKITLLGLAGGATLGCHLALEHPEKYDAVVSIALSPDFDRSAELFKQDIMEAAKNDPEYDALAHSFDPTVHTREQADIAFKLEIHYHRADDLANESDVSVLKTVLFNPYFLPHQLISSIFDTDYYQYLKQIAPAQYPVLKPIEVKDRTEYQVPFYLAEGTKDYTQYGNVDLATAYYAQVTAPDKDILYVEGKHASPMLQSKKLAAFLHEIAQKNG